MTHRFDIAVRFYELDPYRHVNHAVYLQYFETARIALLDEVGLTMQGMMEDGLMIVVAELRARFVEPAVEGDQLVVETEVAEFGRVTTRWRQRLLRGDELLVEQEVVAAVTNLEGRPQRFPERFRDRLERYLV
jgi:acyl-CoA thioester hydrolase